MKSLFTKSKQASTDAGIFKFSFKLGGEEDLANDAAVTDSTGTKKKKNRKKKKKSGAKVSNNDDDDDAESETNADADDIQKLSDHVSHLQVEDPNPSTAEVQVGEEGAKTLSKSQKKNKKRSKGKCDGKSDAAEPALTEPSSHVKDNGCARAEKGNSSVKSESSKSGVSTADSTVPKLSQQASPSKRSGSTPAASLASATKSKASTTLAAAQQKEDWEIELDNAILANAQAAKESKNNKSSGAKSNSPIRKGGGKGTSGSDSAAPHFLSAKDPELDEATRLRWKYGMGRNLVAIGPAKVRDPNWLPPPPGLVKPTAATSAVIGSSSSSGSSGGVLGGGVGQKKGGTEVGADGSRVSGGGKVAAAFGKKACSSGGGDGAEKGTSSSAVSAEHSSPFSFSFGGL